MIHVIAIIDVVPGKRQQLLDAFHRLRPLVLAEDGCLEYGTAVDEPTGMSAQVAERADTVLVVEKWASVAALEAHLAAPHMDAFRTEVGGLLRGLALQVLRPA